MAGRTILAPNTELAAALFDAIERAHQSAGDEIWPTPRVRDFAGWLREQYVQRQLSDSISPRVLSDVEERELWRVVIDTSELGSDMLDPAGAARAARRARRTLREYDIPLQALMDDKSEEVQALLAWNEGFEQRCRDLRCISADTLLIGMTAPREVITWIESPHWRPVAHGWLRRHGEMLLPQAADAKSLATMPAPSATAELSAMAHWAGAALADDEFRAWICVPELNRRRADVADALDAILAPHRFGLRSDAAGAPPYAIAGGTPLGGYASVRAALSTLAAAVGSLPFEQFSALLRAPELQATDSDSSAAALADVVLRRHAPHEADLASWLDLADRKVHSEGVSAVSAVARLRASQRALSGLGARRMSEWVSVWVAALEAGPWALRSRWSSMEYQAAERFRELLASLSLADAVLGSQSAESAQRILRRAVKDTPFQVQTGVPAVWVSGQLNDPWLNYDALWICGCNDEQWPPPIAPVPLLPVQLQRRYGVISAGAETQLALATDLQNRWQNRADQCVFSYADPGDGSRSTPSPLLPKRAFLKSAGAHAPRPHWHILYESAPRLESLWDEQAPPVMGNERSRGVATLKAQSRCAFRGFAETRLDTQPLEHPVPGFNERERGELVHHALEHIWSQLRGSNALHALAADAQHQLLDEAARRALAIVCRLHDPGPRWRARERLRLHNLLGNWLEVERARAPFVVEALEGNVQVARFGGHDFRVRIDRRDLLADGARVLIDYKTGAAGVDWRGERPDNPQLAIYALLRPEALVAVAYARVNAADPGFVSESERREIFHPRSRDSKLEGMPNFAALVDLWSRRVQRIAEEFVSGRAEVAPTRYACRTCQLQGLCRVPASLEEPEDAHE